MNEMFPTRTDLIENPELAPLQILRTNLQVTEQTLLAAYPDSGCGNPERCHTEQEAYAIAILYQIDTLVVLVDEYAESVRHLLAWRSSHPHGTNTGGETCNGHVP